MISWHAREQLQRWDSDPSRKIILEQNAIYSTKPYNPPLHKMDSIHSE